MRLRAMSLLVSHRPSEAESRPRSGKAPFRRDTGVVAGRNGNAAGGRLGPPQLASMAYQQAIDGARCQAAALLSALLAGRFDGGVVGRRPPTLPLPGWLYRDDGEAVAGDVAPRTPAPAAASASAPQARAIAISGSHGTVIGTISPVPARSVVTASRTSQPTNPVVIPPRTRPAPVMTAACHRAVRRSWSRVAPSRVRDSCGRWRWVAPMRVALTTAMAA